MKRYLPIIFISLAVTIIVSALFFTRSGEWYLRYLPYFKESYKNSSLSVTTRKGIASIEINDKAYGETPLVAENLEEGRYEVKLTKKVSSDQESFYDEVVLFVDLYKNTEAIIDIEIGPEGYKAGYLLYYTPAPQASTQTGFLTVKSSAVDAQMLLDGDLYGKLPISVDELEEGEYKITVSANGFESIEVPIIVRQGYNLNVNTFLLPVPVNLVKPAAVAD